jgi:replicative DNA helicase
MERNGHTTQTNGRRHRSSAGLPAPMALDRLPPHSIESEQGLLGCVLTDYRSVLPLLRSRTPDLEELFYDLRHAAIARKCCEVTDSGRPLDLITLQEALKAANQLEAVGGITYLSALMDVTPSAANAEYYLDIVEDKAQLRKLIQTCTRIVGEAYEAERAEHVLGAAERDVLSVRSRAAKDAPDMVTLVGQAVDDIEEMHQRQGRIVGVTTGLIDLDRIHDGLHTDEFVVLAAYPSTGKTALAMNIAVSAAEAGHHVGVVTQEMRARRLVGRMLAARARVNLRNIRDGFLAERDFPKLAGAASKLAKLPISFCDIPGLSIYQVMAKLRQWKQQHGLRVAVVDYLQLLNAEGGSRRIENRQLEVADISRGCKAICAELGITLIGLSQLNDDGQLRESRAIGQDADSVWKLRSMPDEKHDAAEVMPVALDIEKQRNGPSPYSVHLTFFKGFTLFESAAKTGEVEV